MRILFILLLLAARPEDDPSGFEILRYECANDLGRREVTLFLNGTIRLRDGEPGKELMGLGELNPDDLQGALNRLAGEDLSEAQRLPSGVDGQWVEAPNEGGTFVLEQEVNTERVIEESDYMNNTASVCVNIPPKNGHDFVSDPSCITPPAFEQANDCEMCLALCASIADVNAQQSGCPCAPLVCPSSSGT